MNIPQEMIDAIECHNVETIREVFSSGIDPNAEFRGEPLINELTSEYARTPRFKECIRAFVDFGLRFEDEALLAVLLDDAEELERLLASEPGLIKKTYSMRAAYSPLLEASLLHICAEYNHVSCANLLIEHGAAIDAPAGFDEYGFGGQTPIFHTVNQNSNNSFEMFELLLSHGADVLITIPGVIWGKGYPWETLIPAVNPISYAMMGSLPQMHRDEAVIIDIVSRLLRHAFSIEYTHENVPNAYLQH